VNVNQSKPPQFLQLAVEFRIFVVGLLVGGHRDLCAGWSCNLRTTDHPWKGRGHVTWSSL